MYLADLHIHSKYSRATSRDCVPELLDLWARRKGIQLLGTGDFTHPAWRQELQEKFQPAEEGLYLLKEEFRQISHTAQDRMQPRFVVTGEISSIYKKNGKVRKVHNVILLPSLEAAESLSHKLEAIGNIHSDGRPILGLDSRDLLEITLETCPEAVFIPAHIWTPHFSLFGAFSGFDTIEECFGDLTPHIHALETGLSSDPAMNWRLSALDAFTLVSNSDAHSPSKLGREANLLDTALSYPALSRALQGGKEHGFAGTIEFFPEEGKYHLDGHRNCKLCLTPAETEKLGGRCPICGKKITIGVQHRVEQLADRAEGFTPPNAIPFESLVPLQEVIAASIGISATGTRAQANYEAMLREFGSEFSILREIPLEEIGRTAGPCIEEGLRRLRNGQVERTPGYDGEYGTIQLLLPSEIDELSGQTSLFGFASTPAKKKGKQKEVPLPAKTQEPEAVPMEKETVSSLRSLADLNQEQKEAVVSLAPVVSVIAGPGTGKTKTLISRIAYLVEECGVKPGEITAVTFTNRAAEEMRQRLEIYFENKRTARSVRVGTFHALCLQQLEEQKGKIVLVSEAEARSIAGEILRTLDCKGKVSKFLQAVSNRKNGVESEDADCFPEDAFDQYEQRLHHLGVLDFDDLLLHTQKLWEGEEKMPLRERKRFTHLLVDEFQDINPVQYRLTRTWSKNSKGLFVIGDPDQAIYGFRGANARCFVELTEEIPDIKIVPLIQNYRSTPEILQCALSVIAQNKGVPRVLESQKPSGSPVRLLTAESDLSEAIFVAKEINRMVGGIDMLDAQTLSSHLQNETPRGFSDIAVLYRTHRQADLLEKCLRKEGIPHVVSGRDDFLLDNTVRGTLGFFGFLLHPIDLPSLMSGLRLLWNCPEDLVQSFASYWEKKVVSSLSMEALEDTEAHFYEEAPLREWFRLAKQFLPLLSKEKPRKLLNTWKKEANLPDSTAMERLLNTAVFHKDMVAFLQTLLLGQESDLRRSSSAKSYASGAVTLMTLHGSKGLEFPVVFLCGVKKGKTPLESASHTIDLAEERRLFYVGMTRAREELLLLTSSEPSPFLQEIDPQNLSYGTVAKPKIQSQGKQLSLFD